MAEFSVVRNHNGKIVWLFSQSGSMKIIAKSWDEYDSVEDCVFDIEVLRDQISLADLNDDVKPMNGVKKKGRFSLFGKKR